MSHLLILAYQEVIEPSITKSHLYIEILNKINSVKTLKKHTGNQYNYAYFRNKPCGLNVYLNFNTEFAAEKFTRHVGIKS